MFSGKMTTPLHHIAHKFSITQRHMGPSCFVLVSVYLPEAGIMDQHVHTNYLALIINYYYNKYQFCKLSCIVLCTRPKKHRFSDTVGIRSTMDNFYTCPSYTSFSTFSETTQVYQYLKVCIWSGWDHILNFNFPFRRSSQV